MRKLLLSVMSVVALFPVTASAAQGYNTVKDLRLLSDESRAFFIGGVYLGFNEGLGVGDKPTCQAPTGSSITAISAMVESQWRAFPQQYDDLESSIGVVKAICTLWPPAKPK
ncbi:hypothetical protein [Dyella silvae]|uniref:hypothetical protein n=1 Tax=Dyella silvae TaxID=2994424 RepID=UPI0022649307|nr:hypothetical protein [Dyella silvae]